MRVGAHASDMLWRAGGVETADDKPSPYVARIFVAAANTNNVFAFGVSAGKELNLLESINMAMTARQPLGMTPSAFRFPRTVTGSSSPARTPTRRRW